MSSDTKTTAELGAFTKARLDPRRELEGLVALVTGAGAGIGQAIVERLAAGGAGVAVVDLNAEAGGRVANVLREAGADAAFFGCDVTDRASVDAMAAAVVARFGKVDVLVNNAGGPPKKAFLWEMDEADWNATMAMNLKSAFLCCRAVMPGMLERRTGVVLNMSSDQAFKPTPKRAGYAAAKAALVGLTRALATDAGPFNVRVNLIAPGPTLTEKTRALAGDAGVAALAEQHPNRRLAEPVDIAEAIAYLASPRSRHVTGHILHVNGGLVMG